MPRLALVVAEIVGGAESLPCSSLVRLKWCFFEGQVQHFPHISMNSTDHWFSLLYFSLVLLGCCFLLPRLGPTLLSNSIQTDN